MGFFAIGLLFVFFLIFIMSNDAILLTLQNWSLLLYFYMHVSVSVIECDSVCFFSEYFSMSVYGATGCVYVVKTVVIGFVTGSTWCVWYVQKFEFVGHATYKKRWYPDDLFLFWSCDPKWDIPAYSSGIYL